MTVACCTRQIAHGGTRFLKLEPPKKCTLMTTIFRENFPELDHALD